MDLPAFLTWLTDPAGGAFVLVSWFASWALEEFQGWHRLPRKVKAIIVLAGAVVLGLAGQWLAGSPALVALLDPYFRVVFAIVSAWLALQTAYRLSGTAGSSGRVGSGR